MHIGASAQAPESASEDAALQHDFAMKQATASFLYHRVLTTSPMKAAVQMLSNVVRDQPIALVSKRIEVPGLPFDAIGISILHVTDLHLPPDGARVDELVEVANRCRPDLVVYTGDFIDTDRALDAVADLVTRMPTGRHAFAVLGNHDYFALSLKPRRNNHRHLIGVLERNSIRVLRNSVVPLPELGLQIVGVDDPVTGRANIHTAIASSNSQPAILLAHSPDIISHLQTWRPVLVLAGHTHGGQVRIPLVGPLVNMSNLARRHISGFTHVDGVPLHVSPGVGCSGVPFRVACPPQLSLLQLSSPPPQHCTASRSLG